MYTFFDSVMYLQSKTLDIFFEKLCTLWYQVMATTPQGVTLVQTFKILSFSLEEMVSMSYTLSVYEK